MVGSSFRSRPRIEDLTRPFNSPPVLQLREYTLQRNVHREEKDVRKDGEATAGAVDAAPSPTPEETLAPKESEIAAK